MRMFCQSPTAKLTAAEAKRLFVDASRKSAEYPEAGNAERSPKLFPSMMNRLPTVPLPVSPPLMSVRTGAAIVKALLSVADPPPGFATVMLNTVPAALRLDGAEVTATSRPVELNDVTDAGIPAPPPTGVKVTVGFTALAPDPDCRKPEPWMT